MTFDYLTTTCAHCMMKADYYVVLKTTIILQSYSGILAGVRIRELRVSFA